MVNRSLRFCEWPIQDQAAWERAIVKGGLLDGQGPAAHWAEATKATNIHSYGRWLAFVAEDSPNLLEDDIAVRSRKDVVQRYVTHLQATTASTSVASSINGLVGMLRVMALDHDWDWLMRVRNKLKCIARPIKDKRLRVQQTDEILLPCLDALKELSNAPRVRKNLVSYRNALMLGILACCPIRRKNFAALNIGSDFIRHDRYWRLSIAAERVKNNERIELEVQQRLTQYVDFYLSEIRPQFLHTYTGARLWLNWYGAPMSGHSTYLRMIKFTQKLLGLPLPPHLLRNCAADTLTDHSPEAAFAAPGLLLHRDPRTTNTALGRGKYKLPAK